MAIIWKFLSVQVLENQLVPLTSSNLAYEDRDTAADHIYYTITKPLGEDQGRLEHVERPFKSVRSFTQDDVNNNRIIYRPPEGRVGSREMEFIFYFTGKRRFLGQIMCIFDDN